VRSSAKAVRFFTLGSGVRRDRRLAMMQFIREFAAFGQLPELRHGDQIRKGSHKSSSLLFYAIRGLINREGSLTDRQREQPDAPA